MPPAGCLSCNFTFGTPVQCLGILGIDFLTNRLLTPSPLVDIEMPNVSGHGQLASPMGKKGLTERRMPTNSPVFEQTPFLPSLVQGHITMLAAPTFLVLLIVTVLVHELAHLVTAVSLGIPVAEFTLFEPTKLAPVMYMSNVETTWNVSLVGYAGGLATGGLWLLIYLELFIRRRLSEAGPGWWLAGLAVATLAAWQLGQGFIEGGFPEAYLMDPGNPANAGTLMQLSVITMGATIHLAQTQLWRGPWLKPSVVAVDRNLTVTSSNELVTGQVR